MSLIVDGYNLLHASGIIGCGKGPGGLRRSRSALLNFLAESLSSDDLVRTIVVFDASDPPLGLPHEYDFRGMSVRFAVNHEGADDLIEELIRQDSAPRNLTVVSSDHRLQRAARRRKAQAVDSDRWFGDVIRQRAKRRNVERGDPDAEAPLPNGIAYWLREFGLEPRDDEVPSTSTTPPRAPSSSQPSSSESIFPQEYLDELDAEES